MSSADRRDPVTDHLLTPENSALVLVDYQPPQVYTSISANPGELVNNVVALARTAVAFDMPVILSTAQVENGVNPDTIPQLREVLPGVTSYDRTVINAWEDTEFVEAVRATGRKKLIFGALWTEVCLAFPVVDALREGFEIYVPVDCVGGTSAEAHRSGLDRVVQAGAVPVSWISVLCELKRDWNREESNEILLGVALQHGGAFGNEVAIKLNRTSL
jgi:nicotinamidase-related amidase